MENKIHTKKRRVNACFNCNKSHLKCEQKRPCSNCLKSKKECYEKMNVKQDENEEDQINTENLYQQINDFLSDSKNQVIDRNDNSTNGNLIPPNLPQIPPQRIFIQTKFQDNFAILNATIPPSNNPQAKNLKQPITKKQIPHKRNLPNKKPNFGFPPKNMNKQTNPIRHLQSNLPGDLGRTPMNPYNFSAQNDFQKKMINSFPILRNQNSFTINAINNNQVGKSNALNQSIIPPSKINRNLVPSDNIGNNFQPKQNFEKEEEKRRDFVLDDKSNPNFQPPKNDDDSINLFNEIFTLKNADVLGISL